MRPIRNYAGELTILSIGNGGAGLLFVGSSGNPDARIQASTYLVFMRSPLPPNRAIARESGGTVIQRVLMGPARKNSRGALLLGPDDPPTRTSTRV